MTLYQDKVADLISEVDSLDKVRIYVHSNYFKKRLKCDTGDNMTHLVVKEQQLELCVFAVITLLYSVENTTKRCTVKGCF